MKKLFLFFIISVICSTYAADDESDVVFKKQKKFINKFLKMDEDTEVVGSAKEIKKSQLLFVEPTFNFFDIVQKSDPKAYNERAVAYGQYMCRLTMQAVVTQRKNDFLSFVLRQGADFHIEGVKDHAKGVLVKLEAIKRFQVKNDIPVSTKEFFDKLYEKHTQSLLNQIKSKRQSMHAFEEGYAEEYEELRKRLQNDSSSSSGSDSDCPL